MTQEVIGEGFNLGEAPGSETRELEEEEAMEAVGAITEAISMEGVNLETEVEVEEDLPQIATDIKGPMLVATEAVPTELVR